jgi:hypothetical protein
MCFGGWVGIVLAAIVGVAVVSTPALAAKPKPAGKRIAVLPPSEATAKDVVITGKIANVLKQHKILAVAGGPVKKALGKGGVPASDGDWIALARTLKVDGVVESTVSETGGKRRVEVVVHDGVDGSVAGREVFAAKGPPAKLAVVVAGGFWKKLGSAIKATTPPKKDEAGAGPPALPPSEAAPSAGQLEEATPAVIAEKTAAKEDKGKAAQAKEKEEAEAPGEEEGEEAEEALPADQRSAKAKRGKQPRAVEVEVGGRVLQRVFQYDPTSAARSYVEHFLPVFEGRAAWFPITYAGIFVSGELNPLLKTGTNPAYPTGTRELVAGAQGRYPLSFGLVGFSAAYFQHMFVIGDTTNTNDPSRSSLPWPDVAYEGARFAASGRFYLWNIFQVGAEAAYRLVTNPGEGGLRVRSSYYFPNGVASYGVDGSAFVSVGIVRWLEIRVAADYRRYVFGALQPGPDNANNTSATGATDQYLGFSLGAVGVYGGK